MSKTIIQTDLAPAPVGPYNQAVVANGFVFCSGQIPIDPATGELSQGNAAEQCKLVMDNLQQVLAKAGSSFDQAVKCTIFLADMNDFATINEVYASYFNEEDAPARATVEVGRLPKDVKVEIDAIAVLG